jgi:hypothetical protein
MMARSTVPFVVQVLPLAPDPNLVRPICLVTCCTHAHHHKFAAHSLINAQGMFQWLWFVKTTDCAGHLMKNFVKRVHVLDANIKVPKGTPKLAHMPVVMWKIGT